MEVKVEDYGLSNHENKDNENLNFITYKISNIGEKELNYLNDNLEGKTKIENNSLFITIYYDPKMFPFQSDEAKNKMDDFIAREEIEMKVFISSFLEDLK